MCSSIALANSDSLKTSSNSAKCFLNYASRIQRQIHKHISQFWEIFSKSADSYGFPVAFPMVLSLKSPYSPPGEAATLRFGFAQAREVQAGAERQAEVPSSGTLQVTHWSTDVTLGIWWILMVCVSLFGKWLMMVDLIITSELATGMFIYIIIHMYICNCSYLSILMFTFCPRGECRIDAHATQEYHVQGEALEEMRSCTGLKRFVIFVIHR